MGLLRLPEGTFGRRVDLVIREAASRRGSSFATGGDLLLQTFSFTFPRTELQTEPASPENVR